MDKDEINADNADYDIIYFELNNWMPGTDYPNDEPFITWLGNDFKLRFRNEDWIKEQKLCVVGTLIDMSCNFCITATRQWVEENCPKLLTDYQKFLRYPDEDGNVYGRFGGLFLEYTEDNIGYVYREEDEW